MDRRSLLRGLRVVAWLVLACATGSLSAAGPASPDAAAFDPFGGLGGDLAKPVTIAAAIEPGKAGGPDVLAVTATLEDGWHLYSVTQKPGGPLATRIVVAGDSPRRVAGPFVPDVEPVRHEVADVPAWKGLVLEEHEGVVTWRAPLEPGAGAVRGEVSLQLCQANSCSPPDTIPFTAAVAGGPVPPAGDAPAAATWRPDRVHATLKAALAPPAADGSRRLVIEIAPDDGWHLYPPAGRAESKVGEGRPTIVAASPDAARILAVAAEPAAAASKTVEGPVRLELLVAADGAPDVVVGLHTCSGGSCDPPAGVRVTATPEIAFAAARYADAARAPLPLGVAASAPPATAAPASTPVVAAPAAAKPPSLPVVMLSALLGGLILNLMPCVLPVLGLKLMSFAQQSGRERREVFAMNLWYCAGVYAVFLALATASVTANIGLASTNLGWGQQFQFVSFRIAMLGVVFAFALSFLGVWEIPIPGFIGEQAGHVQTREGPVGSFLKGVLGTVLATPCSGPFLGSVFGFTLGAPTPVTYAVFAAIATGMALPYIVVGLFPGLVRFMPKPGAWMATFKELLGFVMLGTVAYLFSMLRQQPVWFVPTFVMLIGIWMGCWWVGRLQERQGVVGFDRWVQGAALAAAVGYAGFFWLGPHVGPGGPLIAWEQPFSAAQLSAHRARGSTVLVDFTADWCPTCKTNIATAIETHAVAEAIRRHRVVPILADFTDRSPEIDRFLASMGSRSIPFLVIYPGTKPGDPPRDPIVLRDAITQSQLLAALDQAGPSQAPPGEIRSASAEPAPAGR
ncbi:MAG: thioredoxin family protein [Planctomycetaceae bacterium]